MEDGIRPPRAMGTRQDTELARISQRERFFNPPTRLLPRPGPEPMSAPPPKATVNSGCWAIRRPMFLLHNQGGQYAIRQLDADRTGAEPHPMEQEEADRSKSPAHGKARLVHSA